MQLLRELTARQLLGTQEVSEVISAAQTKFSTATESFHRYFLAKRAVITAAQ